jgi:hypothetical protein
MGQGIVGIDLTLAGLRLLVFARLGLLALRQYVSLRLNAKKMAQANRAATALNPAMSSSVGADRRAARRPSSSERNRNSFPRIIPARHGSAASRSLYCRHDILAVRA